MYLSTYNLIYTLKDYFNYKLIYISRIKSLRKLSNK